MLKAPPLIPRTYISKTSKINPREGRFFVQKYVGKSSKIEIFPIKRVNKNVICPINVAYFLNILHGPNVANLGFWRI